MTDIVVGLKEARSVSDRIAERSIWIGLVFERRIGYTGTVGNAHSDNYADLLMTAFRDLNLPPWLDTSSHDLTSQFFEPLLSLSRRYDRGVGFFSSGWLRKNALGMIRFAQNSGRARWVTSPILDEADWEALLIGDTARGNPLLLAALERSIGELAETLERDTLSALAWMVGDEILSFKLALPRNKLDGGDFHDKFGVFTDAEGNQVSFNGSYNDSIQGMRNYESIKVFCSWHTPFASFVTNLKVLLGALCR